MQHAHGRVNAAPLFLFRNSVAVEFTDAMTHYYLDIFFVEMKEK